MLEFENVSCLIVCIMLGLSSQSFATIEMSLYIMQKIPMNNFSEMRSILLVLPFLADVRGEQDSQQCKEVSKKFDGCTKK